jgi:hypothetical protein
MNGGIMKTLIPDEMIMAKICNLRGYRVMLDRDLAELYNVQTKALNQAVKRNISRFPDDFMFQLEEHEFEILKSQIVTSRWGGVRKLPFAFTENGVAMLSSVLTSERAVQVNIQIMRTFTHLRKMLVNHEGLKRRIDSMEKKYDQQFKVVFDAIKRLLVIDGKPKRKIGF